MKEKRSGLLGVNYITFKDKFVTDTGVVFTHEEVKGMPHDALKEEYAKRLEGTLYDYQFLKSTGHLRRHKNMEDLRSAALSKVKEDSARPVEMEKMIKRDKKSFSTGNAAVTALRIIMGVVGAFAVFLSANYTTDFLLTSNKPSVAFILSWAMIIFSVAAFDLIIYFWSRHKNWALSAVFGILWVVVVSFSMFSTMEVNFRGYRALEKASVSEYDDTNSARLRIELLRSTIDMLREELRAKSEAYQVAVGRSNFGAWYVDGLQKDLTATSNRLSEETKKLESLLEEFAVASVTEATKDKTFYDVFEDLFGIEAERVHFFIHMLPAIFIDIIAPFSIAVALFLGGSNGNGKVVKKESEFTDKGEEA